jgi:hypothetical protein
MFIWEKLGKIFSPDMVGGREWMKQYAQAPASLEFESFIRVYFSTRPLPDEKGQFVSHSAFVDIDKNNMKNILRVSKTPVLELGALGNFDQFGTYPFSAIRHEGKIRAYYAGWTRCVDVPFNTAIGVAESEDDGITFKRLGSGPILSYTVNEPFVISGPKIRKFKNKFFLYYIAGSKWKAVKGRPEPIYKIRMATSDDGILWHRENRNLIPNCLEDDEAQASPDVSYFDGYYHMFFCYRNSENYRNVKNGYRIGYARSLDAFNWERQDSLAGLEPSLEGWDSGTVSYPHLFRMNGQIFLLYHGSEVGKTGFGIAKLKNGGEAN